MLPDGGPVAARHRLVVRDQAGPLGRTLAGANLREVRAACQRGPSRRGLEPRLVLVALCAGRTPCLCRRGLPHEPARLPHHSLPQPCLERIGDAGRHRSGRARRSRAVRGERLGGRQRGERSAAVRASGGVRGGTRRRVGVRACDAHDSGLAARGVGGPAVRGGEDGRGGRRVRRAQRRTAPLFALAAALPLRRAQAAARRGVLARGCLAARLPRRDAVAGQGPQLALCARGDARRARRPARPVLELLLRLDARVAAAAVQLRLHGGGRALQRGKAPLGARRQPHRRQRRMKFFGRGGKERVWRVGVGR
mmetsp:Transcript_20117/g.62825  ORF Transcript_20117/g.62825 Transcript_20117/m.62825 type:complete len:309 (+) Transcript_20117:236-1162(+)